MKIVIHWPTVILDGELLPFLAAAICLVGGDNLMVIIEFAMRKQQRQGRYDNDILKVIST